MTCLKTCQINSVRQRMTCVKNSRDSGEKVCNRRLVKFHSDNGTLKANIVTSSHHCIKDFPAIGWVRGDSVSVLENFNAELLQSVQKFQSAQETIGREIAAQKKMTEEKLQQLEGES